MFCIKPVYEYVFTFNGKQYNADYCSSTRISSYCILDNERYENVEYKQEFIRCDKEVTILSLISPIIPTLIFIIILCLLLLFAKFIFLGSVNNDK